MVAVDKRRALPHLPHLVHEAAALADYYAAERPCEFVELLNGTWAYHRVCRIFIGLPHLSQEAGALADHCAPERPGEFVRWRPSLVASVV